MKTEIELANGDCVVLVFAWEFHAGDESVGVRAHYEYMPDYYTPYDEYTGDPLLPVNAVYLNITPAIEFQLEHAVDEERNELEFSAAAP